VTDTNRYGPTAARQAEKPGRECGRNRPPSTSIRMSACRPPPRSRSASRSRNRSLAHYATANVKALNAKQEQDRRTRMTGLDKRPR